MKVQVGHEELWVVVLDGTHCDACEVDLPREVAERCRRAQAEWEECLDILTDAFEEVDARKEAARKRAASKKPKRPETTWVD